MMAIPIPLQQKGFRFIKLREREKAPFEIGWSTDANYSYDDDSLNNHIERGGNFGVATGFNNLVVIDFDDVVVEDVVSAKLPPTFSVRTGSGRLHLYFLCDRTDSFKIMDANKKTLVDVQGTGKQVVGPGSTHPNGNKYSVVNEREITTIAYDELKAHFSDFILDEEVEKKRNKNDNYQESSLVREIKNKIKVSDLLRDYGIDTTKNPCMCPLGHDSSGGKCLSYDDMKGLWKCFHCDEGGDVINMAMLKEGKDFAGAVSILREKAGIEEPDDVGVDYFNLDEDSSVDSDFEKKLRMDVISYLLQKKRQKATELLVKALLKKNHIKTTRQDDKSDMWIYREGIYVPHAKTYICEYCRLMLGDAYTSQLVNEVVLKIEADTYIDEHEFFNQQNENPYLLPVQNGLLDLKKRVLLPFTPDVAYFNKINSYYKEGADCPEFKKFLKEILLDDSDVQVVQELLGFSLIRDYLFEKAFMFFGSHGRNGKSKLLEVFSRWLGRDNVSSISLQDLEDDDFSVGNLHNKLMNISGEISNEAIKNTGRFKAITGRDSLSANRKFKSRINFISYAKVVFAANELPPVYTLSDAFWLRWVIIEFPYQFLPQREIDGLSDKERENVRVQDPLIVDKITSQDELDGILLFALDGLVRLLEKKDFSTNLTASQIRKDWQRKSNSVSAFVEDFVEEAFNSYIIKSDFLKEYQGYCQRHRLKIMSDKVIKLTLKEVFGISEGRPSLDDGSQVRVWNGIRFKISDGGGEVF